MTAQLFIPVIAGTTRDGRWSIHAARFVHQTLAKRPNVETEIIDIADLDLHVDTAGQGAADPRYQQAMVKADGIVIVSPEYNHSFPGLLKHVLDTCLPEYIHKAAGVVGVSAGAFGGTRVIANLLPVLRDSASFRSSGTSTSARFKKPSPNKESCSMRNSPDEPTSFFPS